MKENPEKKKQKKKTKKKQTHMNKFLKIPSISSLTDILLPRSVCDNIEAQIYSLQNLDAKSDMYGPVLMPLLQSKIQNKLNLISIS